MKHSRHASHRFQRINPGLRIVITSSAGALAALFLIVGLTMAHTNGGPSLLQQKQQVIQTQLQSIATARAQAGPKRVPKISTFRPLAPSQPLQTGIAQTRQGPFPASFFVVRSLWQGPIGSTWVAAFAGGKPSPDGTAQQGAMLLYTVTRDNLGVATLQPIGTFLAPNTPTLLSIISVNGTVLQLQSESGSKLTFDLQTHQYGA